MHTNTANANMEDKKQQDVVVYSINKMKRAVGARLADPNMTTLNALKEGGFTIEEMGLSNNDNNDYDLDVIDSNEHNVTDDVAENIVNVRLKELEDKFNAILRRTLLVIGDLKINNNDSRPQQQQTTKSEQVDEEICCDSVANEDSKNKCDSDDNAVQPDLMKTDEIDGCQNASSERLKETNDFEMNGNHSKLQKQHIFDSVTMEDSAIKADDDDGESDKDVDEICCDSVTNEDSKNKCDSDDNAVQPDLMKTDPRCKQ